MNRVVYCFAALSALVLTVGCKSTCCGYDPDCPLCVTETSGYGGSGCRASGSCGASRGCGPGQCGAGNGPSCAAPSGCGCAGIGAGAIDCGAAVHGCAGCAGPFPTCTACGQAAPMYDTPVFDGNVIPGQSPAPAPPTEPAAPPAGDPTTMIIPTVPTNPLQPQQTHWVPRASK